MKKLKKIRLYLIWIIGRIFPRSLYFDRIYIKMLYKYHLKRKLDLDNPKTYNEKLQWLKLYDRKDIYTKMVDKCEVKDYVKKRIGKNYLIKTLGVWNNFDDIDFDKLPNSFVLKCTHDSGGLVIVQNKKNFDKNEARKKINHCLKRNYYLNLREWPYKNVKPRIIAEEYMVDESGYELKDYKFFCFNGTCKAMFIATDRNAKTETCFDFYDTNFNHLPFTNGHPNSDKKINKPENFDKMIELAEILSKDIPQCRVDFYNINGKIYFGEITFFHWSGLVPFEPEEWDYKFGSWINLDGQEGHYE